MEDLSLHLLDIAENSIDADAAKVEIKIIVNEADDRFTMTIIDNGRGMDAETLKMVKDPFFSTKAVREKKFGLGIPLLAQAAGQCNGAFLIESNPGGGAAVTAVFQNSHIDRKPLGNMGATMAVLIGGHPDVDFLLSYDRNGLSYRFDSREIKKELGEVPINLPNVLKLITEDINTALKGEV